MSSNGGTEEGFPVVRSVSGRDKDRIYVMVCKDESFAYLSDGRKRPLNKTKKKRSKHVCLIGHIPREQAIWINDLPKRPIEVRSAELRKTLKAWKNTNC
ncbi:MAG: hypothetical protein JW780_06545 [Clostridiales bacterium]|nr:hypothetical protein [Clostridiales bacterium]